MSLLFRNTTIHQIFGANTDVGKTILTTALTHAALEKKRRVLYLKPVSTGPVEDEDDRYVADNRKDSRQFNIHTDLFKIIPLRMKRI